MTINVKLLVSILLISQTATKHPRFDASFRDFCTKNGQIQKMGSLATAPPFGDKCTVNWGLHAGSLEEAKEICTDMGVHHLSSWKTDAATQHAICEYESIHICRDDWTQIRGRCYKIGAGGELQNHGKAVSTCQYIEGGDIFSRYNDEIARLLSEFFADLAGIWTFIPKTAKKDVEVFYVQDENSAEFLTVYGTASWYGLGYSSLIKVNDVTLATAMCEYIPLDTPMSFRAKLEKLKPYYHPSYSDGVNTFWRTASYHDDRIVETSDVSFRRVCQKSMASLLNSKMANALDPLKGVMNAMPKDLKKANPMTYAPFRGYGYSGDKMISCAAIPFRGYADLDANRVTSSKYNIDCSDCRRNGWKAEFITYSADGNDHKIYSALRQYSPYWCNIEYYPPKDYKPCEQGWTQYDRKDGSRWCHKHFGERQISNGRTQSQAKSYCAAQNAELAGWEEEDEYKELAKLGNGYVNVMKNDVCGTVTDFGTCSKKRMFFHYSRAGDHSFEGSELIAKLMDWNQPDHGTDELCVDIRSKKLHDISCNTYEWFLCSKEAEEDK